jgi:hypothetical protein
MVSDWNNRSFRELANSDGESDTGNRTPFEAPFGAPPRPADTQVSTNTGTGPSAERPPVQQPEAVRSGDPQLSNGQWRSGYGGIAPIAQTIPVTDGKTQTPPPASNIGNGQWRSGYGGVAPGALNLPPMEGTQPQPQPYVPNPGYNQVAPGARTLPPMDGGVQNGGVTAPGDPGRWQPSPNQIGNGNIGQPGIGVPNQPGFAGADPIPTVGYNANGGMNAPSDAQRQHGAQSLNTQLNYFTHFAEGAIGGLAGSSIIPYFGDKLAWKTSLDGNRVAEYWRNNHSPLGLELRTRNGELAELQQRQVDLKAQGSTAHTEMRQTLRDVIGSPATGTTGATGYHLVRDLRDQTVLARDAATGTTNQVLAKKADLLTEFTNARPRTEADFSALKQRIDIHKMPAGAVEATEVSFLSQQEAKLLRQQLDNYEALTRQRTIVGDLRNQGTALRSDIAATEAEMAALRAKGGNFNVAGTTKTWTDRVRPGAGGVETELTTWNGQNKWRAAGEGIAIVSTGLAVNYAVDKFAPNIMGWVGGKDAELPTKHNFWLQGPAVAAAMLWPNKNFVWRLGMTAGSVALTSAIDWAAPSAPSATYSRLMQPNWGDALGMSAAWMMPFGSWKGRAIAVGTAWAGARALNALEGVGVDIPGISNHNFAVGMSDDTASALASNKVTENSFSNIRSTSMKLAMENEGQLLIHMGDFMNNKTHDPLYHLHGSAALYTTMGDLYMQRGTKLDPKALNDQKRVLAGENYDIGGQALGFYRQALTNLVEGQNQAAAAGRKDEQAAMAAAQKQVVERIETIYGPHNMQNVHDKLKEAYHLNIDGVNHYQVSLKQQVDSLQTRDTKFAAKMCRDLAVLDLAIASFKAEKNEGGGAQIMYTEALSYIEAAKRIDPNNPDLKALEDIARNLRAKVPQAVQNQNDNRFNAPFQHAR